MATSTLEKIKAKAEEARTKQAAAGAGARMIRLDLIDFDPSQPRQDFYTPDGEIAPNVQEKLEELAASMKIHGQQAEVTVKEQGNGRYLIAVGERRIRAALWLGLSLIHIWHPRRWSGCDRSARRPVAVRSHCPFG